MNHLLNAALFAITAVVATPVYAQDAKADGVAPSESVMITANVTATSSYMTEVIVEEGIATESEAVEPQEKDDCSGLLMLSAQGDYPLQDLGVDAAAGKPVTQNMIAATCGKISFDVWTSTALNTPGTYGKRGTADEIDIEFSYDDSFEIGEIGKVKTRLYVGYFALDLGGGLDNTSDDYIQLQAEVAKPIEIGKATVEPYVRVMRMIGVSKNEDFSILRLGARFNAPVKLPIVGDSSFSLDVAHAMNDGSFPDSSIWRGEAFLGKSVGGGWTILGGFKATENVGFTPVVKATFGF